MKKVITFSCLLGFLCLRIIYSSGLSNLYNLNFVHQLMRQFTNSPVLLHATQTVILYQPYTVQSQNYIVLNKSYPWSLLNYEVILQNISLDWYSPLFQHSSNNNSVQIEPAIYRQTTSHSAHPLTSTSICPAQASLIGNISATFFVSSLRNKIHQWQIIPVLYQNDLCYFALVWVGENNGSQVELPANWHMIIQSTPALTFNAPQWNFAMGQSLLQWQPADALTNLDLSPAGLHLTNTHNDPRLLQLYTSLPAEQYPAIKIKMRTTNGTALEFFWKTPQLSSFRQEYSESIPLTADNNWHEYIIPLAQHPQWQGIITELRLDPTNTPAQTEIEYIMFLNK